MTAQRPIEQVWISDGGSAMHLDAKCVALAEGQEIAFKQGNAVHHLRLCPVNVAQKRIGFNGNRLRRCGTCWPVGRPVAAQDVPEHVATWETKPVRAEPARSDRQRSDLADKAARALASEWSLTPAEEAAAAGLIRGNWFGTRPPGVAKYTRDEIKRAVRAT